jgi:HEAT repeat protein
MSDLLTRVRQAALNPQRLALKAIRQPQVLPAIIEGLKADKPRVKYGCAKALRLISEQRPDRLYPFFDFFVGLLDHENKILQWEALFVLSHLARADDDDKCADVLDRYLSPIPGPVMITAANAIQGGARIAQAKPHLADRIAAEILKVPTARYGTAECRNVAIGHAIVALGDMLPLLRNPAPTVAFVRRQTRNPRPATRRKAARFLRSRLHRSMAGKGAK